MYTPQWETMRGSKPRSTAATTDFLRLDVLFALVTPSEAQKQETKKLLARWKHNANKVQNESRNKAAGRLPWISAIKAEELAWRAKTVATVVLQAGGGGGEADTVVLQAAAAGEGDVGNGLAYSDSTMDHMDEVHVNVAAAGEGDVGNGLAGSHANELSNFAQSTFTA
jgi:hypothetical protein